MGGDGGSSACRAEICITPVATGKNERRLIPCRWIEKLRLRIGVTGEELNLKVILILCYIITNQNLKKSLVYEKIVI